MKDNFKYIIKSTVENHSDSINPDEIWGGIEEKLGKKKKRFAGYWWMGILSLLLALLAVTIVWKMSSNTDSASAHYAIENQEVINNTTESVSAKKSILSTNTSVDKIEDEAPIKHQDNTEVLEEELLVNVEPVSNSRKAHAVLESSEVSQGEDISLDVPIAYQSRISDEILNQNQIVGYPNIDKPVVHNESNDVVGDRSILSIPPIEYAISKQIENVKRLIDPLEREAFVYDMPYKNDENNFQFLSAIEVYGGLSVGSKTVSASDQDYAAIRNGSEKLLEQWNAGVRLDIFKVMDFQVQSGIEYSMITDRMQVVNEYQGLNEYAYVTWRLVDDAIVKVDSAMVTVDSLGGNVAYTTTQYNSQRIVSIPLEISFGRSFDNLEMGIGFGIDLNYQLADTHVILGENEKPVVNKVGGKWVSPSFGGSLRLGYHLSERWSVTSRINFSGLSLSDHMTISDLQSKYTLYGIELGLKRRFGY